MSAALNATLPSGFALEPASAGDFEAPAGAAAARHAREPGAHRALWTNSVRAKRLANGFEPEHTHHIVVDARRVGFVVLKALSHAMRLNHLYIDPPDQDRGIGHQVLQWVCAQADRAQVPVETVRAEGQRGQSVSICATASWVTGEGEWGHRLHPHAAVAQRPGGASDVVPHSRPAHWQGRPRAAARRLPGRLVDQWRALRRRCQLHRGASGAVRKAGPST